MTVVDHTTSAGDVRIVAEEGDGDRGIAVVVLRELAGG